MKTTDTSIDPSLSLQSAPGSAAVTPEGWETTNLDRCLGALPSSPSTLSRIGHLAAPAGRFPSQSASADTSSAFSLEQFLDTEQRKDMLRLSTAGSVDDGKSTLIGRLLYDSRNVYEDHVRSVTKIERGSARSSIDFAQLTDGLRAEREQGITIDVAYRYFSTERRKFIIADTPGHEQYTRNMATGASTADLAIILIDASKGILTQSRRHVYITSLLGIRHLVAAINKMDLVDFSWETFARIEQQFAALAAQLGGAQVKAIPLSALDGDNVVERSARMPWYEGPTLLEHLENVPARHQLSGSNFRLPVQRVIRPSQSYGQPNFRGFAGQIAAGTVQVGDQVITLPSGRTTKVASITTFDGDLNQASSPQSVAITLEDEFDISRGDLIASQEHPPQSSTVVEASVVWFDVKPLDRSRSYIMKHTSQTVGARVTAIRHRVNVQTLAREKVDRLAMNEIGQVEIETLRPIFFDPYRENRTVGSFILIDADTNATAAAGIIQNALAPKRAEQQRGAGSLSHRAAVLLVSQSVADQLEDDLLYAGAAVVRTRVHDANLWRALEALGVIALAEIPSGETATPARLALETHAQEAPGKPQSEEVLLRAGTQQPAQTAAEIVEALRIKGILPAQKGSGSV